MRFFRSLLAFGVGLAAVAAALFELLPRDTEARDAATALAPICDWLLVGPSFFRFGVVRRVAEEEARRLGHRVKVCKFTRVGLRGYELRDDLEGLLARPWPHLERVVVDVTLAGWNIGFEKDNWYTERMVHWHTWRAVPWLVRYYRQRSAPLSESAPLWVSHLQHLGMNYLSVGRGARWRGRAARREDSKGSARAEPDLRRATTITKTELTPAAFRESLARLRSEKALARQRGEVGDADWPRELEGVIRERGYEPVFVISPAMKVKMPPSATAPGRKPLVFLDFTDPERYPELYTHGARGRTNHLSREGALAYSRLLARELVGIGR